MKTNVRGFRLLCILFLFFINKLIDGGNGLYSMTNNNFNPWPLYTRRKGIEQPAITEGSLNDYCIEQALVYLLYITGCNAR